MIKQLFAEYLGMTVSTIAVITAVGGYAATLASDDDLQELKRLHQSDIQTVQIQMMQKSVTDYADKVEELQIKPNRSTYENDLLELYKNKQQVEQKRLDNFAIQPVN